MSDNRRINNQSTVYLDAIKGNEVSIQHTSYAFSMWCRLNLHVPCEKTCEGTGCRKMLSGHYSFL